MPIQWTPIRFAQPSAGGGGGGGGVHQTGGVNPQDQVALEYARLGQQAAMAQQAREVSPRDAWQAQQQQEGEERRANLDAELYGAKLSMQEQMEMNRLRNALGAVDSHPGLSAEERNDMRLQITTRIDPMERRQRAAQMAQTQQQTTHLQMQNERDQTTLANNNAFAAVADGMGVATRFAPGYETYYQELAADVHYGENLTPQQLRQHAERIAWDNGHATQWRRGADGNFSVVNPGRGGGTGAGAAGGTGAAGAGGNIEGETGTTGSGRQGQIDINAVRERARKRAEVSSPPPAPLGDNPTAEQRTQYLAGLDRHEDEVNRLTDAEVRGQQRSIAATHRPPARPYRFDYRKPEEVPEQARPFENQIATEWNAAQSLAESGDPRAEDMTNALQQASRLFRRYGGEREMPAEIRRSYDRARTRARAIVEAVAAERQPQQQREEPPAPTDAAGPISRFIGTPFAPGVERFRSGAGRVAGWLGGIPGIRVPGIPRSE